MGRIKEIERRASGKRKRKPVVYLICEGSETEIRYFKRFRTRDCNIDIIPIPSQYKSADSWYKKQEQQLGIVHIIQMRVTRYGVCLIGMIIQMLCLQRQNRLLSKKDIILLFQIRVLKFGSSYILIIKQLLLKIVTPQLSY